MMNYSDTFVSSFQDIISHPLRSLMTLIAIVIGIFAVVVMFSSIHGIKTIIRDNMEEMGLNNSIRIYPGSSPGGGVRRGSAAPSFRPTPRQAKPLDYQDFLTLQQHVEHRFLYGVVETWFQGSSFSGDQRVQVVATNSDYFFSRNFYIKEGRSFSAFEMNNSAKVCIPGSGLTNRYFPDTNPIGETIEVGGILFVIIGVMDEADRGGGAFQFNRWEINRQLNALYIPLTTGITHLKEDKSVDYLAMQSIDSESYREMTNRARQVLLANHNMSHNFRFHDIGAFMADVTSEIDDFMKKWNITLTAIASISLLVGGLGLFSTMLISIGERLLEIGIRKSVGASPISIFMHFLVQSMLFALIGAAIGIGLSLAMIKGISLALDFSFPVVYEGIILGIVFALIVGLLSGLYPAIKAAEADPIKAIYYNE